MYIYILGPWSLQASQASATSQAGYLTKYWSIFRIDFRIRFFRQLCCVFGGSQLWIIRG